MPQKACWANRERQYDPIKEELLEPGDSKHLAEEIAARTVNRERARTAEADQPSQTSIKDLWSGRRGGLWSHRGPGGRTRDRLYQEARRRGITGRSRCPRSSCSGPRTGRRPRGHRLSRPASAES